MPAAAAAGGGGAQQYERRKVALEEREVVLLDASLVCAGRDGVDELWESAHLHGALVAAPGPQWRAWDGAAADEAAAGADLAAPWAARKWRLAKWQLADATSSVVGFLDVDVDADVASCAAETRVLKPCVEFEGAPYM